MEPKPTVWGINTPYSCPVELDSVVFPSLMCDVFSLSISKRYSRFIRVSILILMASIMN